MFKRVFWEQAIERAVRAFSYAAIGVLSAQGAFQEVHWSVVGGAALMAAIMSILVSLVGTTIGDPNDPSFLR
jgi:hypothetical protein